mgnify:CR=1 FL=1
MKANHIATLIDLAADACMRGEIALEFYEELNAALWEVAAQKDLREDVHNILQAVAEGEFDLATGST